MLNVIMPSGIMLNAIMLSVILLNAIMLSDFMFNVIMLSAHILSDMAPSLVYIFASPNSFSEKM
jgi:hypothetical protein